MIRELALRRRRFDELSLFPFFKDVRSLSWQSLKGDSRAAFSVATLAFPQAIAYSLVAGLSPAAGLFGSIFGVMIAALLGSSSVLILGPSSATIMLVQAAASEVIYRFHPSVTLIERQEIALGLMAGIALLIGFFQLSASFFKLGRLIQFVSYSVVIGYLIGTVVGIVISQLFSFCGMTCPDSLDTLYQKAIYLGGHFSQVSGATLTSGLLSLFLLWFFQKNGFGLMSPLAMLVVITLFVLFFNHTALMEHFGAIATIGGGDITQTFDRFHLPMIELDTLNYIIPVAFALAVMGMLETNSIAKTISSNTGEKLSSNQELFSLGATNAFLAFFRGLPCSASLARSTLNIDGGAKTRFAACLSGLFVLLATLLTGGFIQYLPQAALSAFLFSIVPKMIDRQKFLQCFRATRSDRIVLMATLVSCFFLSLHVAFYVGIILSIVLYLRKASTPRLSEWVYSEEKKQLRPLLHTDDMKQAPIRIIKVEGELFFGAVDVFYHALRTMAEEDAALKVLILKLKHVHDLDVNFAIAIKQMFDFAKSCNKHMIIDSIPLHVSELLDRTGVADAIGRENLFPYQADPNFFEKTYQRAQEALFSNEEAKNGLFKP